MIAIYHENLDYGRFQTCGTKPSEDIIEITQVHGTDIVTLETIPCEADGLMASWEEIDKPLVIKTADCLPIIIEGEKGVVVLHAGWRGLAQGILKHPKIKMINPQRVLIGPCIHECCFEVSADFKNNFPDSAHFSLKNKKLYFNLPAEAKSQLQEIFPELTIKLAPICTSCDLQFHSYRRDKTTQRNWNLYIKG